MLKSLTLSAWLCAAALPAFSAPWTVDDSTRIQVDVSYLGRVVKVVFDEVNGAIDFDPKRPEATRADIRVKTKSAETGLGLVNGLVKSRDYLNARNHPEIRFVLQKLKVTGPSSAKFTGEVTLLGVTKPTTLDAKLTKLGPDKNTPAEAGFLLTGEIDRAAHGNTTGIPQVSQVLPVRIQLSMKPK